jgi:hypothetical protein
LAKGIPARLTPAEGRKFAFTVGAAFLVLAAILWWRGRETAMIVTGALGGVLALAGLVVPGQLGPVYRAWMRLALLISKVTTPIFMGLTYFLVLAPSGLLMRALGKNPIVHKEAGGSFWASRPAGPKRKSDLTRQF